MKANEKISVIVPVYNVKLYLHKCVDSILNQTYQNIEVLLIDDGSTDGSSDICDSYTEKDWIWQRGSIFYLWTVMTTLT